MSKEKIIAKCKECWVSSGRGRLLLAVSGGADSIAMLAAFKMARIPVEVAHCNFNLRGDESLRDRDFVKAFCTDLNVPLHIAEFNTLDSSLKGESLEMTCRRLRYDFFRQLKEKHGFSRIAVAHNSDDNIETFFLNLLRGSGSRGLKGMEKDSGEIIRPLLNFSRKEIIEFLNRHDISFIVDSTNLESDYRRNFLRNEIFPLLESRWEGFRKAVNTTIEIQSKEYKIINHALDRALEHTGNLLPWTTLDEFADPETLIFYFIKPFGGTPVIASEMAESARERIPGKLWILENYKVAVFTREGITLMTQSLDDLNEDSQLAISPWIKLQPDVRLMDKIRRSTLSEIYLPYDATHYQWTVPTKDTKIKSLGMHGSQNVFKVLKDAGVPAFRRSGFPILIERSSGEPIWIPGIKRSRLNLVTLDTPIVYYYKLHSDFKII